jgi:hypothetical protein
MTDAPLSIKWFETVQIVSVIIGLINEFALLHGDIFRSVTSAAIILWLTFLVSRRRKDWPRWVFLGMLVLGAAWVVWSAAPVLALGYLPAAIAIGVSLMNAVAVVLLFTSDSAKWVQPSSSSAEVRSPPIADITLWR